MQSEILKMKNIFKLLNLTTALTVNAVASETAFQAGATQAWFLVEEGRDEVEVGRDGVEEGRDEVEVGRDEVEVGRDGVKVGRDGVKVGRDGVEVGRDGVEVALSKQTSWDILDDVEGGPQGDPDAQPRLTAQTPPAVGEGGLLITLSQKEEDCLTYFF